MSIHFELRLGHSHLGFVEIRRASPVDRADPGRDTVCTYEVQRDFERVGTVEHRYGDGAFRLVSLATALIAEEDA